MLDLVDKVLKDIRSDVNIKYSEHGDVQETPAIKRKCYEIEGLRKTLIEQTEEYKDKIALGADIYKILDEGKVEEGALATDMKGALDLYMKQGNDLNYMDVDLKPWQRALMEEVNNPTDRHVIWVIGRRGNEGKTWFQKYIKSTFGARRVVSGINLMTKSGSICHALTKYPLATTDIFLFNIARSKRAFEEINYKILEDLKDGDAFADKYESQLLKIKWPNEVVVFSNDITEDY